MKELLYVAYSGYVVEEFERPGKINLFVMRRDFVEIGRYIPYSIQDQENLRDDLQSLNDVQYAYDWEMI